MEQTSAGAGWVFMLLLEMFWLRVLGSLVLMAVGWLDKNCDYM